MGVPNLTSPSVVLTEQIITIDKTRVMKYLGKVSEEQMSNIDKAIMVSLNLGQSFTDCPI
jgi:mRNA-degrading endonuclease toxin of MazEF toxin-antitoxin module